MPTQPIEVARNSWGAILHHPQWRTLELKWFPSTRHMTDDDFKATLELHTSQAERLQPIAFMLIDATEFFHTFGADDVMTWRDEQIIPRYNAAGVTPAVEGRASFPTGWFSTREGAYAWLADN